MSGGQHGRIGFAQIHRSHLVNLKQVPSLKPRAGESEVYKIAFKDSPIDLPVGLEYLDMLSEKMTAGNFKIAELGKARTKGLVNMTIKVLICIVVI